jgi:hypothetical protein
MGAGKEAVLSGPQWALVRKVPVWTWEQAWELEGYWAPSGLQEAGASLGRGQPGPKWGDGQSSLKQGGVSVAQAQEEEPLA